MNLKLTKDDVHYNLFLNENVVNIRAIHKENLPYIFIWVVYYAWVIAFATWWTASPLTEKVFGTELRSMIHFINLISSAVFIFIIQKEWFVKTARTGAVLIIAGMSIFLAVPEAHIQLYAAVLIGISLGCVNTSILMPFVFTLNNTEKLYAVVGSNVLINIITLFKEIGPTSGLPSNSHLLISLAILIAALSATLFFDKKMITDDSEVNPIHTPQMHSRVYLTLLFNCTFAILSKGAGKGILNIAAGIYGTTVLTWYYIGGLAGCLVYIAIYAFSQKSIHLAWNFTFGCLAMGLLCNAFAGYDPDLALVFAVFLGIGSTIGMTNMYYILGVIGKKYNSMRYLRLSILFIGICGGVSGVAIGNLIGHVNTFEISVMASIISAGVMLAFLILSPILAQVHYEDEWVRDSRKTEIDNEQVYMFKKYQLSKREMQVCQLLLQGYTLRQISATLSIAYSTVNTYCTGIYRKLGINSRTELLIMFKDYVIK